MHAGRNLTVGSAVRLLLAAIFVVAGSLGAAQTARAFASPAPVDLGAAGSFAILSKSGISTVPASAITGNIGVSPIDSTAITGFSLIADSTNTYSRSTQVTGKVYAADYADPTPANMTTAISNMETAYTNAAGRSGPDATELYAGNLTGQSLAAGLYKWSTGVSIDSAGTLTFAGSSTDVWILQIAGDMTINTGAQVLLSGGARASNIFWQVAGGTGVNILGGAHVEGNILALKAIIMGTGASLNGRALAQTAVTLDHNTVVFPEPNKFVDFNGDGTSDIMVYRNGAWLNFDYPTGLYTGGTWTGFPGGSCIPAPMDYDGDGTQDFTQLCGGAWHFYNDNGSYNKGIWVGTGALPVPADYNNDGKDDVVVFKSGAWLAYDFATGAYSAVDSVWTGFPGGAGTPVALDYNGDGSADRSVLSSAGAWHFYNANGSYNKGVWIGNFPTQFPVAEDYNGDNTDDVVVFRSGAWLYFDFATGLYDGSKSVWTGNPAASGSGVIGPAPVDYNGDSTLDLTYYSGDLWYFYTSTGSFVKTISTGGVANDRAISARQLP